MPVSHSAKLARTLFLTLLGASASSPQASQNTHAKFELTSSAFEADGTIPTKYSCAGDDVSPELSWKNAPKETQSFVLIVDDPDNPKKVIVHWLVYDLPATAHELPESTP